jgi:putative hemolysin
MTADRAPATPFTLGYGPALDALLGLRALQRHYEALPPGDFPEAALARLDIHAELHHLERLPRQGPALVIVNHPTGAMDGLVLLSALRRVRPDVRVLGNRWLTRIPEMREWTIPLDVFTTHTSRHVAALRQARRWLTDGGVLVVFPAGAVARRCDDGGPVDGPWNQGVLALARWTDAPIVPVHLGARPSRWLRVAAHVHPWLATAMLPRELLRQRGARVAVRLGHPVDATRLRELPDTVGRLAYLRARVSALGPGQSPRDSHAPVAPEILSSLIAREIAALPGRTRLLVHGPFEVYCTEATAIPMALREIGRLRERTFREVGEGTGWPQDLDRFDERYLHLFLWNRSRSEIAGAYRMALTQPRGGRLYTETLFRWREAPHRHLGAALELGRSFVRAEYQRDPSALLSLWKGIGAFVARHPHVRRLFGPVSVSAEYSQVARYLIAAWLTRESAGGPVQPRHEVPVYPEIDELMACGAVSTVADLDALVRELEGGRGLPVLLRQYLRLNGRVLGVSCDPSFANAMDALLVVDMLDMPAAHLERYCGRDGAARVRQYWGRETASAGRTVAMDRAAHASA